MSNNYLLVLGANLSDPQKNIENALQFLQSQKIKIIKRSSMLNTKALLSHNAPDFINQGIVVETNLLPPQLLAELKSIEKKVGRKKRERYGAREIDIDIVWWSGGSYHSKDLQIPHVANLGRYWVRQIFNELIPQEVTMAQKNTSKPIYKIQDFAQRKATKEKITMLTCYDYLSAKLLSRSSIDTLLVGDSLSNVMQGVPNTLSVTVDEIIYHSKAVRRGYPDIFVTADLPFLSYQSSDAQAVENAGRILKESNVNAVKLEGGSEFASTIKALTRASIPVMGHLGLTPQSYHSLGGYRVQAKEQDEQEKLLADALALQEAGAFAVVLELVPAQLAKEVSESLSIPTIGIGAGNSCDGQVLVWHDMLGLNLDFSPKFVRNFANLADHIAEGVEQYCQEVRTQNFPNNSESY